MRDSASVILLVFGAICGSSDFITKVSILNENRKFLHGHTEHFSFAIVKINQFHQQIPSSNTNETESNVIKTLNSVSTCPIEALVCPTEANQPWNKTTLMKLNLDCQLTILEQLDLESLRNLAQTNDHFLHLASDVFKRRISKKNILIYASNVENDFFDTSELIAVDLQHFWVHWMKVSLEGIWDADDSIEIRELGAIVNVMKYFGDAIQRLTIRTEFAINDGVFENIGEMISKHCSESLVELKVWYFSEKVLKHIKKPFRAVESVSLHYFSNEDISDYLAMDELFPQMKRLSLALGTIMNNEYIVRHYPHVNSLKIKTNAKRHSDFTQFENDLKKLIEMNAQIRNLDLDSVPSALVGHASKHFTNLDSLSLAESSLHFRNAERIHFYNVTKFSAKDDPAHISFDHLQELHVDCEYCSDEWIDFMAKHPNLQQVHILVMELDADTFKMFTKHVPNVRELSISSHLKRQWIDANILIDFLNKHNKLQKFSMRGVEMQANESIVGISHENLDQKWIVTGDKQGVFFERVSNI